MHNALIYPTEVSKTQVSPREPPSPMPSYPPTYLPPSHPKTSPCISPSCGYIYTHHRCFYTPQAPIYIPSPAPLTPAPPFRLFDPFIAISLLSPPFPTSLYYKPLFSLGFYPLVDLSHIPLPLPIPLPPFRL